MVGRSQKYFLGKFRTFSKDPHKIFAKFWFWVVLSGSLKMPVLQKMTFSGRWNRQKSWESHFSQKNRFFQKSKILTLEWILTKYIAIISEALQVVLICFLVPTNMSLRFLFLWLSWGIDISDFKKIDFFHSWAIFRIFGNFTPWKRHFLQYSGSNNKNPLKNNPPHIKRWRKNGFLLISCTDE